MAPTVSVEADVQTRMRRGTRAIGQAVQEALGQASDGQVFAKVTKDFAVKEHRIRNTNAHIIELDNNTQKINRLLRDLAGAAHHVDDAANSARTALNDTLGMVFEQEREEACEEPTGADAQPQVAAADDAEPEMGEPEHKHEESAPEGAE
ncbi:hypothetical protein J8273_2603 [Carpediemonas membranifera]|uniref:Uncharacterized protein n=1 Tax=Carpediemonas membranifera TaxID=201153 RepID=A0A8J6E403_9EUKA|nr:hypothetical protein J8273_2603 [Carpediemonas membranifera]|eukprot:KAG9396251.1 hypothetical protein J8273_2603 [Carpediemonas membranifera]